MTRHPLSKRLRAVAALAILLAAPSASLAQTAGTGGIGGSGGSAGSSGASSGGIDARIVTIGGESQDQLGDIFINLEHCQSNVEVELEIDNIPSDKAVLDIYVSTGTNCSSTEARDGDGDSDCAHLDGKAIQIDERTKDVPVTLTVRDIVVAAFGGEECASRTSKPKLWFLAVDNEDGTDAVSTNQYGSYELIIDTDPPDPPSSVKGGSGENEIPVSWSIGTNAVDAFEVYVDTGSGAIGSDASTGSGDEDGGSAPSAGGATNTMCGSGRLHAGDVASNVASLRRKRVASATATETTLSPSQVGGDSAAVAVVAIDEAGNASPLSEVVCVSVVPTTGFKDLYEQENGEIPQGCPCSAAGPAQLEGALPIALALGIIASRRRRRS